MGGNSGNKGLLIGVGVVVAVAAVAGYFILTARPKTTQPVPEVTVAPQAPQAGETKEITVEGNEYSFKPASLTFNNGDRVVLTFKNTGKLAHNYTIDELGVATRTIAGGQSDTVEFTVEKSGTFSPYCSVGNHRSLGMEGEVEVK